MLSGVCEYIDKLVCAKKLPYIDVIVKKEHNTLFRYATGYEYCPNGNELLQLYSLTKPVISVCIMQLVEKGLISIEDEVEKFLPEYALAFIMDSAGQKIKTSKPIKIKHLLTMTAGLTYDTDTLPIRELKLKSFNRASTREMVATFIQTPLAFEPGADFLYGLCYDVLGAIIEVVTGTKLSNYVQEKIFKPLDMQNSTFDYGKVKKDILQCYTFSDGKFIKADNFHLFKLSENYDSAGAGIIGTIEDYSNFADTLACGGKWINDTQILGERYIEELASEQISKLSVNNTYTCVQGKDYGYGYGVRVRKKATDCGIPKGEFGWDGAAGSYLLADRLNKTSITIGMNILNWPNVFTGEHLKLANLIYKQII